MRVLEIWVALFLIRELVALSVSRLLGDAESIGFNWFIVEGTSWLIQVGGAYGSYGFRWGKGRAKTKGYEEHD